VSNHGLQSICPVWSDIIHSDKEIPKDQKRKLWTEIRRPSKCVVAEAYGFSDDYATTDNYPRDKKYRICIECKSFSSRFSEALSPMFYVREDHSWKRKAIEELRKKNAEIKFEEMSESIDNTVISMLETEFINHWKDKHCRQ